jgi:hypothetical protein
MRSNELRSDVLQRACVVAQGLKPKLPTRSASADVPSNRPSLRSFMIHYERTAESSWEPVSVPAELLAGVGQSHVSALDLTPDG